MTAVPPPPPTAPGSGAPIDPTAVPGFTPPPMSAAGGGPRPQASVVSIVTLALVCVLAVLVLVVVLISFGSLAASSVVPEPPEPNDINVYVAKPPTLNGGDCLDTGASKDTAAATPCTSRHDAEVMGSVAVDYPKDTPYPGKSALSDIAGTVCPPLFVTYVGQPYSSSELDVGAVMPTAEAWKNGDRFVVCYAADPDGNPLSGSIRGSGR